MKLNTCLLLCLLYTCSEVYAISQCQCQIDSTPFPGSNSTHPANLTLSPQDEYVGGQNVGKLISVGSIQILQQVFGVIENSAPFLRNYCPDGYVPLSKDDLITIIARPDFNTLIGPKYLNLNFNTTFYYSSTKVYPNSTVYYDPLAYYYYTLNLDSNNKPIIDSRITDQHQKYIQQTICKRNSSLFKISLLGYEGFDLEKGKSYQMQIVNNNVQQYYIYDNNGNKFTSNSFTYTHNGDSQWGCATLNFKLQLFGGQIVGDCISIWTKNQFAFNADSKHFNINQIKSTVLPNVKASAYNWMFYISGQAPTAPIYGDSSSFYVFYSVLNSTQLLVQKVSSTGAPIGSAIDTKQTGMPLDIVSTDFGFVVMASDQNTQRGFIQAINKDGSQRWLRILANNGQKCVTPVNQINFYQDVNCTLPFGMECMLVPLNGRLNYARGKIQALFGHDNQFTVNVHNGDTLISLDADTGFNQNIFWSWGNAHSMLQTMHYDGKNLYTASLSDSFPQGIYFRVCNIDTYQCISSNTLLQGTIPQSNNGTYSGRMGGFYSVIGNRNQKLFVYQTNACQAGLKGVNVLAVVKLDSQLNYISTTTVLSGDIPSRINNIKTVPYGQNILLAYNIVPPTDTQCDRQKNYPLRDIGYVALLSGVDGSILVQPQQLTDFQISANDDWRLLENGSVVYTYVNFYNNTLTIYNTPALNIPNYPNPIKTSDTVYGFKNFTNFQIQIPKNNYNDVCTKPGDPNGQVGLTSTSKKHRRLSNSMDSLDQEVNAVQYSSQKLIASLWITLIIITFSV
ncbi:hypothetical protein ABPG74_006665 [Tetrahymena malaccensis]